MRSGTSYASDMDSLRTTSGAGGAIMSAQKISRGFHRLGVFLAAIPLLAGGAWTIFWTLEPEAADFGNKFLDLGVGFAISLVTSLAVYGVVRAIGWVIGGFAAS